MLRPRRALLHPLWLGALALHVVNDHLLKGAGILPTAVTGKLSDVAVLITTPTVLAVLLGVRTERTWRASHLAMGALFVALEVSPTFTAVFRRLIALFGFGWTTWSDWTDLLTLPALLVSATILGRVARTEPTPSPHGGRPLVETVLVGASSLACLATSSVACPDALVDPDDDRDGAPFSTDCDEDDPTRHPGAVEVAEDGVDQDCDGADQTSLQAVCAGAFGLDLATGEGAVTIGLSGTVVEGLASCAGPAPAAALRIFVPAFEAPVGRLTIEATSRARVSVAALSTCEDETTEVACAPAEEAAQGTLVAPGSVLFVLLQGGAGNVAVRARVEPILCGDGLRVEPEACDDGNLTPGDGCNASCETEESLGGGA